MAGFDWYVTNGIAIGAELGLGFQSQSDTKDNGASAPSLTRISLATSDDVHLVVHF